MNLDYLQPVQLKERKNNIEIVKCACHGFRKKFGKTSKLLSGTRQLDLMHHWINEKQNESSHLLRTGHEITIDDVKVGMK